MRIIYITIFLFLPILLLSQTFLFEDQSSGPQVAAQFTSTQGSTLFAVSPGYTIRGKTSLGITVGSEQNNDSDLSSTLIRPYVEYLAFRQGHNNIPINVTLYAAYQHNIFKDFDLSANTISFGGGLFYSIKANDNLNILPGASVVWSRTAFRTQGFSQDASSVIGYGLHTYFHFGKFYVQPNVQFSEGNTLFHLILGALFPN